MTELKPCKCWDGIPVSIMSLETNLFKISCSCGIETEQIYVTREEAIAAWNKRSTI